MTTTASRNPVGPKPPTKSASELVTPSNVNAQEKTVAMLTVKKTMPFSIDAFVSVCQKVAGVNLR